MFDSGADSDMNQVLWAGVLDSCIHEGDVHVGLKVSVLYMIVRKRSIFHNLTVSMSVCVCL